MLIQGATRLFTHREGDALASAFVKDSIVRVVPSGDTTGPGRVELREFLNTYGAAHVWFAPRAAARQVVASDGAPAETLDEPPRIIIMRMVAEAHTKDRAVLEDIIEAAITAEGL